MEKIQNEQIEGRLLEFSNFEIRGVESDHVTCSEEDWIGLLQMFSLKQLQALLKDNIEYENYEFCQLIKEQIEFITEDYE